MAQVTYGGKALEDFERIIEFWLDYAPVRASAVVTAIREATDRLADHPYLGRRVEGDLRELVISWGATGYLALYTFDESSETIVVGRIRHQREAGYDGD